MNDRRDFMRKGLGVLVAGYAGLRATRYAVAGDSRPARKPNRLTILIIGGTGFAGSHHVHAAHERGHVVTVLRRQGGEKNRSLPQDVKVITGDLYGDLGALKNQSWDAVIDFAEYAPQGVRNLGKVLGNRVNSYVLFSTVSTYARNAGELDEMSPQLEFDDPVDPFTLQKPGGPRWDLQYGSLKVLCEREAEAQFPGKSLIIRPGAIVGPDATSDFLAFWIARMERGGEIAVPGDPLARVQLIDARDLAYWVIRMVEEGATGTYNATGPSMPLSNGELMGAIRSQLSSAMQLTWIPSRWLVEQKVNARTGPLFWNKEPQCVQQHEYWVSHEVSSKKAYAKGLSCRPLAPTLADSIASFKGQPREHLWIPTGWDAELEQKTLALWHSTMGASALSRTSSSAC